MNLVKRPFHTPALGGFGLAFALVLVAASFPIKAATLTADEAYAISVDASWSDKSAYDATAKKLAGLFRKNFETYAAGASAEVKAAGPNA